VDTPNTINPGLLRKGSGYEVVHWISTLLNERSTGCMSKKSHLPTKMRSHCLFPVVDKSGTSCYHLVTRLMRPTDLQQVVPTSLISSARMSC
jgi:hypothetical protein